LVLLEKIVHIVAANRRWSSVRGIGVDSRMSLRI
jgi:hypothetical protein